MFCTVHNFGINTLCMWYSVGKPCARCEEVRYVLNTAMNKVETQYEHFSQTFPIAIQMQQWLNICNRGWQTYIFSGFPCASSRHTYACRLIYRIKWHDMICRNQMSYKARPKLLPCSLVSGLRLCMRKSAEMQLKTAWFYRYSVNRHISWDVWAAHSTTCSEFAMPVLIDWHSDGCPGITTVKCDWWCHWLQAYRFCQLMNMWHSDI